jgi:hypothetical protein
MQGRASGIIEEYERYRLCGKAGIKAKAVSTPQGLKPNTYIVAFTARLKSCPDASHNSK